MTAPRPLQRTAPGMPLGQLMEGLVDREMPGNPWIDDLTLDSREVGRGSLYLACRGARHHGLEFARAAIDSGALAILFEPEGAESALPEARSAAQGSGILLEPVPRLKERAGALADRFFGFPSRVLAVAGITGTSGKTTTAYLIAQALTALGRPAGYIGTLGCGLPGSGLPGRGARDSGPTGAIEPFGLTTADAVTAHRQLAHLQALGAECVGMEVSSHALAQDRVSGIRFRAAAFTNLTRDHLDFHGSMEAYGAAKARLFERDLDARVVNVDDEFGRDLARRFADAAGRLVLTSRRGAFPAQWRAPPAATLVRACELRHDPEGSSFFLEVVPGARTSAHPGAHAARAGTRAASTRVLVHLPLLGDFNVDNALTAAGVLLALDAAPERIAFALGECAAPPGRMQRVSGRAGSALAIIDYAHKPDALAQALRASRMHCAGKLRVVFGCGGDRDRGKRPMMGRAASELADEIVLTDDNPRTEDPRRIVADIAAGIEAGIEASIEASIEAGADADAAADVGAGAGAGAGAGPGPGPGAGRVPVRIEHDRAAAIRETLARSVAGDVVLIAGKGHEDYQIVGTERRAFSDLAVAQAFLAGSEAHQ